MCRWLTLRICKCQESIPRDSAHICHSEILMASFSQIKHESNHTKLHFLPHLTVTQAFYQVAESALKMHEATISSLRMWHTKTSRQVRLLRQLGETYESSYDESESQGRGGRYSPKTLSATSACRSAQKSTRYLDFLNDSQG